MSRAYLSDVHAWNYVNLEENETEIHKSHPQCQIQHIRVIIPFQRFIGDGFVFFQ